MASAFELHKKGKKFTVVEKASEIGGLSRTYQFGDFRTDNGPHRFFSKNKYLYDFIEDLLGEKWITVNRFTRFYVDGKFYKYPVEWKDALTTMGFSKATRVFVDYLLARVKYRSLEPHNFEEYALKTFGKTLANFNMLNYTEKIWGLPCKELSADWATQRIRGLTLGSLVKNMLMKSDGPKSLVDQFYYPDNGTGLIYNAIKNKIEPENPFLMENEPTLIEHEGGKITRVKLKNGEEYSPENVISSVPITEFVKLLSPAPPTEVFEAVKQLKYRSQVYLFLTVNKPSISKDQWVYFPDLNIPFGRFSEMKNFSTKMSPEHQTSLFVEYFCWEGDETWNMDKDAIFDQTIEWLDKLNFVSRDEVIDVHHIRAKNVYPVYDLDYNKHLGIVKRYLDQLSNLVYIGRPGRFKYTNQDHSLEMGILAARSILEGRRMDVEDVGAEKEYFEQGYVQKTPPTSQSQEV